MKLLIDVDDYAITRIKEFYGIANEEEVEDENKIFRYKHEGIEL